MTDFVAAIREPLREADLTLYETPEQVIAATDVIVLGRVVGSAPGRVVTDPSGDPLYETSTLLVVVDEVLGGPRAGEIEVGQEILVDRPVPAGTNSQDYAATINAALPKDLSTLLGLSDFSDSYITSDGSHVEHLDKAKEGRQRWGPLPQGFVVRGEGEVPISAATAEYEPVAIDKAGTTMSFDALVDFVRDRVPAAVDDATS